MSEGETQDEMVDTWELDEALPNLSEDMFEGGREQTKLTRISEEEKCLGQEWS